MGESDNSLINKGIINENILQQKVIEILTDKTNTLRIINTTIRNNKNLQITNKCIFENNLLDILG